MSTTAPALIVAQATGLIHIAYTDFPATVLAVIKDVALVEYTHGTGSTALAFMRADDPGPVWKPVIMRPCSYRYLLKPWLIAVVQQSGTWQGKSKRGRKVMDPAKLLASRFVVREKVEV